MDSGLGGPRRAMALLASSLPSICLSISETGSTDHPAWRQCLIYPQSHHIAPTLGLLWEHKGPRGNSTEPGRPSLLPLLSSATQTSVSIGHDFLCLPICANPSIWAPHWKIPNSVQQEHWPGHQSRLWCCGQMDQAGPRLQP